MFIQRSGRGSKAGLDIGLALTRELVELHAGTIDARSAGENQGAKFVMKLPLATRPRPDF